MEDLLEAPMAKSTLWLVPVLVAITCFAQDIQVNRQNKTIAVTADDSIMADTEVAVLSIGYHNYAPSQDQAFRENVRVADTITRALLQTKIPEGNIESDKLQLGRLDPDQNWTEEMKKQRVFEAKQSWHVTVSSAQAQSVVDLAVSSGANEVDDVEWNVADPIALQGKASGASLAKARAIAEQMAKGLGTKLGELVYASNRAPVAKMWRGVTLNTETAVIGGGGGSRQELAPKLKLFPRKVKSDATVYAVFAIE
jgi:hypothetical protein